MQTLSPSPELIRQLLATPGKAELIGGRIVPLMPTGHLPNLVAGRIYRRLADYVDEILHGVPYTDNIGFIVPELPSGRESFSPDVSYYTGPLPPKPMRFVEGTPDFAVEVRSENNYGATAEIELAAKRADYFAAGTKVVWDVDPQGQVIDVYRAEAPDQPQRYGLGQQAEAEPAVPGWRMDVRWVMGASPKS